MNVRRRHGRQSRSSSVAHKLGFSPTGNSRPGGQELILTDVIGDLVGKTKPAIRVGIKAVQDIGGEEKLEKPTGAAQFHPNGDVVASRDWCIRRRATTGRWVISACSFPRESPRSIRTTKR